MMVGKPGEGKACPRQATQRPLHDYCTYLNGIDCQGRLSYRKKRLAKPVEERVARVLFPWLISWKNTTASPVAGDPQGPPIHLPPPSPLWIAQPAAWPSLIVIDILGILSIPRTNIIDNYFNNKGEYV